MLKGVESVQQARVRLGLHKKPATRHRTDWPFHQESYR